MTRTISAAQAAPALRAYLAGKELSRNELFLAVRYTLQVFAASNPGRSVEVRIPPAGAVQAIAGPRHTRGTPPNVVETTPQMWLALALGDTTWAQACTAGQVQWSGTRADLAAFLPCIDAGTITDA